VVHPEIREEIPDEEIGPSEGLADIEEGTAGDSETEIAEEDEVLILLLVQRAGGKEVVDATSKPVLLALTLALRLTLMVVMASDVGEQVHGPATNLLGEQMDSGCDGSLLGQLSKLMSHLLDARAVDLPGLGHEHHVALDVTGSLVVLSVGNLPREVGHQQRGVEDPAHGIVDHLGGREGLVTALVGEDPDASSEQALHESVSSPQSSADGSRWNVLGGDIGVEAIEGGSKAG